MFPSCFSFYPPDRKSAETRKIYLCKLDKIVFNASTGPETAIIVSDMDIKNQVDTSIAYVHIHDPPIIKTIYHAVNIISTEAELFAIRYGFNQAIWLSNIECIVITTDSIYMAKKIFDSFIYPYQVQILAISKKIREFFKRNHYNSIDFWNYPSQDRWSLHNIINKETKKFNLSLLLLCKSL